MRERERERKTARACVGWVGRVGVCVGLMDSFELIQINKMPPALYANIAFTILSRTFLYSNANACTSSFHDSRLETVLYKITYFATFGGYGLALLDFLGLGVLIQVTFHPQTDPHPLMTIGLIAMFYGQ